MSCAVTPKTTRGAAACAADAPCVKTNQKTRTTDMYEYRAKIIRVIDGDTVAVAVDLGCDVSVNLTVRLYGINCPERGQGTEATAFTRSWLYENGTVRDGDGSPWVALVTVKDKKEKYGRYLGHIYAGGLHLNEDLLAAGHAVAVDY